MRVGIVGAAAVSPWGIGWRGLGGSDAVARVGPTTLATLAASHPEVRGFEVPALPPGMDAGDPKSRRLMSRAARFAAIAAREALREARWTARAEVGYWLGVGASGGPLAELAAVMRTSIVDGAVSMERLGAEGILASNPLHTFHVLNNFTMCHGAILEGIGGPNGVFFSRGAGTVHALAEAVHALSSGDCARALAGGADTALHPVTWAELVREGRAAAGLVPSEGAGVVALAALGAEDAALAIVEHAGVEADARAAAGAEVVVIAPWGEPPRTRLRELAGGAEIIDVTARRGEALAATPALAWLAGLDRIVGGVRRVAVLSMGPDDELGVVVLGAVA